jgi:hypothetical protein
MELVSRQIDTGHKTWKYKKHLAAEIHLNETILPTINTLII